MPTLSEIKAMGIDNFVNEVVNSSYKTHVLDEEGIKSEEEFIERMKKNKEIVLNENLFQVKV